MTAYADSSFLVRLIVDEIGSEEAVAVFRQLQRPQLVFNRLHSLEVRNALRQKAFMDAGKLPSKRAQVTKNLSRWEARLEAYLKRRVFIVSDTEWPDTFEDAEGFSSSHTLRLGTRAFDILHVAAACRATTKLFITCDLRQAALAKAEGLKTIVVDVNE